MHKPATALLALALSFATTLAMGRAASGQCVSAPGNCLIPHGTPGCSDPECCGFVCFVDPDCCDTQWDVFCVELASENCPGLCGALASGDCFSTHANPACSDMTCCELVCQFDQYCCLEAWDTNCAVLASFQCATVGGTCGDPLAGDCFATHPNGACADGPCCEAVCIIDPTCCSSSWDFLCVYIAENACGANCTLDCPPLALFEDEVCGVPSNDPCIFPTAGAAPEPLQCGQTICGRINEQGGPPDVDVFSINLADPDGDGMVHLFIELRAAFKGFAAVIPAPCGALASSPIVASSVKCVSGFADACVPAGAYRIVVTSGEFPTPGGQEVDCPVNGLYWVKATCKQDCGPVCGPNAGSCFASHPNPGCDTPACCDTICGMLPPCCESAWDITCASEAITLCGGGPPANDACANCTPITNGDWAFSTIGATTDGPNLPGTCNEGFGLQFGQDVWFCYDATCDALVTVETCDAVDYDSRIAVYTGPCDALQLVTCNDDGSGCLQVDTSKAIFQAICGETYRFRVGGFDTAIGSGTLSVSCGFGPECPPPCPEDLNGDGKVDGADLGLLLGNWSFSSLGDIDGNGIVDGADLGLLLGAWGDC
ncbi:MAG: hypothetical protein U0575_06835 [Phycisphaerales bacterium]